MLFIVFPRNAIRSPSPQRKFSKLLQHFCLARRLTLQWDRGLPWMELVSVPNPSPPGKSIISNIYSWGFCSNPTHTDPSPKPYFLSFPFLTGGWGREEGEGRVLLIPRKKETCQLKGDFKCPFSLKILCLQIILFLSLSSTIIQEYHVLRAQNSLLFGHVERMVPGI